MRISPGFTIAEAHYPTAPSVSAIENCFGPALSSLTLGSGCLTELTQVDGPGKETLELKPRSLLVLACDARYRWKHSIPAREADVIDGQDVPLTFRTVIL